MPILKLLRIHHWIKNLFIFLPLFFSGNFFDLDRLYELLIGFLSFSFVASTIYVVNDIKDIKFDRLHPQKSKRPLAAGKISIKKSLFIAFILFFFGIYLGFRLSSEFLAIVAIYFFLNLAYSFGLKKLSIVDIFIVASGFLLRVFAGGVISQVYLSEWLIIMVFLLSLFLAIAKRKDDIILLNHSGSITRHSAKNYNLEFINSVITMLAGIIIVSYIMYTISDETVEHVGTKHFYFSSAFVIAGVIRYLQITLVENKSGSPTQVLFRDPFIGLTILLWILSFYVMLYLL